jgi:hypothetical protein
LRIGVRDEAIGGAEIDSYDASHLSVQYSVFSYQSKSKNWDLTA